MSNNITITQELSSESLELIRQIVQDALKPSTKSVADEDQLLKIDGAAAYLGVSEDTIRSYVRAKSFNAYKKGKFLYFSKAELSAWIKSGPRKPGVRFRAKSK